MSLTKTKELVWGPEMFTDWKQGCGFRTSRVLDHLTKQHFLLVHIHVAIFIYFITFLQEIDELCSDWSEDVNQQSLDLISFIISLLKSSTADVPHWLSLFLFHILTLELPRLCVWRRRIKPGIPPLHGHRAADDTLCDFAFIQRASSPLSRISCFNEVT